MKVGYNQVYFRPLQRTYILLTKLNELGSGGGFRSGGGAARKGGGRVGRVDGVRRHFTSQIRVL